MEDRLTKLLWLLQNKNSEEQPLPVREPQEKQPSAAQWTLSEILNGVKKADEVSQGLVKTPLHYILSGERKWTPESETIVDKDLGLSDKRNIPIPKKTGNPILDLAGLWLTHGKPTDKESDFTKISLRDIGIKALDQADILAALGGGSSIYKRIKGFGKLSKMDVLEEGARQAELKTKDLLGQLNESKNKIDTAKGYLSGVGLDENQTKLFQELQEYREKLSLMESEKGSQIWAASALSKVKAETRKRITLIEKELSFPEARKHIQNESVKSRGLKKQLGIEREAAISPKERKTRIQAEATAGTEQFPPYEEPFNSVFNSEADNIYVARGGKKTTTEIFEKAKDLDYKYVDGDIYINGKKGGVGVAWNEEETAKMFRRRDEISREYKILEELRLKDPSNPTLLHEQSKLVDEVMALDPQALYAGRATWGRVGNVLNQVKQSAKEMGVPSAIFDKAISRVKSTLTAERKAEFMAKLAQASKESMDNIKANIPRSKAYDPMAKVIQNFSEESWYQWAMNLTVKMKLTSPSTHLKNISGNLTSLAISPLDRAYAGMWDKILHPSNRSLYASEGLGQFWGFIHGLKATSEELKTALKSGTYDFSKAGEVFVRKATPNTTAEKVLDAMSVKMLAAEDAVAKHWGRSMEIEALAHRMASREGLTGSGYRRRVQELVLAPTPEMEKEALKSAKEWAFQKDLPLPLAKIHEAIQHAAFLKPVIPFLKTTVNIFDRGLRHTPMGTAYLLNKGIRQNPEQLAKLLGQMTTGVTATGVILGLESMGAFKIHGGEPMQKGHRDALRLINWLPNSIEFSNGEQLQIGGLAAPFDTMFAATAMMKDLYKRGVTDEKAWLNLASDMLKYGEDQTFVAGIADIMDAWRSVKEGDSRAKSIMGFIAKGSVEPMIMAQTARFIDPEARDESTFLNRMQSGIPGPAGRGKLPFNLNTYGHEQVYSANPERIEGESTWRRVLRGYGKAFIKTAKLKKDPLYDEIVRLSEKGLYNLPKPADLRGDLKLTPEEKEKYNWNFGRRIEKIHRAIVAGKITYDLNPKSPIAGMKYTDKDMPDVERANWLEQAYKNYKNTFDESTSIKDKKIKDLLEGKTKEEQVKALEKNIDEVGINTYRTYMGTKTKGKNKERLDLDDYYKQ